MNHKPYSAWMQAALDGDLASPQRRELTEHLTACANCQTAWDTLNDAQRLFKAEPLAVPRAGFTGRFRARVAARQAKTRLVWGGLFLGFSSLSTLGIGAAFLALSATTFFSAAQAIHQPAAAAALYSSGAAMFGLGAAWAEALWMIYAALGKVVLLNPLTWVAAATALAVVVVWGYLVYKLKPEVVLQ